MGLNKTVEACISALKSEQPTARIIDRTGKKRLPIGSEDFAQVVQRSVFVDKSLLIRDILDSSYSAILFCRPRRFGKSLAMRMIQSYFEAPVEGFIADRSDLFHDLAIWEVGEEYLSEQGAHPVVYISLGSARHATWDEALGRMAALVADEANRHGYLLQSKAISSAEKTYLERLMNEEASVSDIESSLSRLSAMLSRHHGTGTIVIIDEYDQMVTAGHLNGYRDQAIGFMRSWLTDALKSTTSLFFACLTGVQRISRESIFSGLNNIEVNTTLSTEFTEGFGFTEAEAEAIVAYRGLGDKVEYMREWYDGYRFGKRLVYNPWSVLQFANKGGELQTYWGATSDNAIVHDLFQSASYESQDDLLDLARGDNVPKTLDLSTVFEELGGNDAALWSQLYLAGYLTTDDVDKPNDSSVIRSLRIPNREVRQLFMREFFERSVELANGVERLQPLHNALLSGDALGFENAFTEILHKSASSFDLASENSYHMLMLGLLYNVKGYELPYSNMESGKGRFDIALQPEAAHRDNLPGIVIELKWGSKAGKQRLENWAQKALEQIAEKDYCARVTGHGVLQWGVACSGKSVVALCEC